MTKPDPRRSIAIHEAGHAVVTIWLRRRIKYATIKPGEDSLGHVRFPDRRKGAELSMDATMDRAASALAGVLAERHAGYRPRRERWEDDRQTAVWLVHDWSGGDAETTALFYRLAKRRAQLIREARWATIESVATALIERETIPGDELRQMVLGLPNPPLPDTQPTPN